MDDKLRQLWQWILAMHHAGWENNYSVCWLFSTVPALYLMFDFWISDHSGADPISPVGIGIAGLIVGVVVWFVLHLILLYPVSVILGVIRTTIKEKVLDASEAVGLVRAKVDEKKGKKDLLDELIDP